MSIHLSRIHIRLRLEHSLVECSNVVGETILRRPLASRPLRLDSAEVPSRQFHRRDS